ncbi:MAG: PLP-dependent lyase/thiolase [Ilumatobacteraceae bacterium]
MSAATPAINPPVTGWRCAVCGAITPVAEVMTWRCPAAAADGHHAPRLVQGIAPLRQSPDPNPFVAFRPYLAWDALAASRGLSADERTDIVRSLDARVAAVAGTGFVWTPFERNDGLSDALGFAADGGVWVKDETAHVAGSHKARHLFSILLHLVTLERLGEAPWSSAGERKRLAIASCGNAAIAASTLAAAVDWPIDVFVPATAGDTVLDRLHALGATVVTCPRQAADPPGDPCVLRFREAVAAGSVPFGVQGTENAWCLDGGRTIGWEMARQMKDGSGPPLDRVFVQVGGGAFASCLAAGFKMGGIMPRLHAVQTSACAPLERAWQRAESIGGARAAAAHWDECMWPWEHVGTTAADGILDDETYDWLPLLEAMKDGNGSPVVVGEDLVLEANRLAHADAGVNASHTGSAGLAGLLAIRGEVADDERVAVVLSGVRR